MFHLVSFMKITKINSVYTRVAFYRGSIFLDKLLTVLWQSMARKQPMYERTCASFVLGDGGSRTVCWTRKNVWCVSKHHKLGEIYYFYSPLTGSKKLTQVPRTTKSHSSHSWRHHVHLFKVYETVYARFITFVRERHILQQQWHEWNDWRLQFTHRHPAMVHDGFGGVDDK